MRVGNGFIEIVGLDYFVGEVIEVGLNNVFKNTWFSMDLLSFLVIYIIYNKKK